MPRRILEGNVVSAKNDKTVTVMVERRFMHPVYKKYIKSSSKFRAHDENNSFKEGDRVSIIECRPISKSKRWTVLVNGELPAKIEKEPEAKKEAKKAEPKKVEAKAPAKKEKKPAAKAEKTAAAKKAAPKKPAAKKAPAKKKDK